MAYNFKRLSEAPEGQVVDDGYVLGVQGGEIVRYPVSGLQSGPGGMVLDIGKRCVISSAGNVGGVPAIEGDYETVLAHLLAGGVLWLRETQDGVEAYGLATFWGIMPPAESGISGQVLYISASSDMTHKSGVLPSDSSLLVDWPDLS